MHLILFAIIEVLEAGDWETVCKWCLGHQDVDDLFDAISGLEEWPEDASVEVSDTNGKRFSYCEVDELLCIWPLEDQTSVAVRSFLLAAQELDLTYETRILFYSVSEEMSEEVSSETAPEGEVIQ